MKAKETNMKMKKSLLFIAFTLIATFAMVLGTVFTKPMAATYADDEPVATVDYGDRRIDFDVTVDGGTNNGKDKVVTAGDEVIVIYKVTASTGVDELQLKLGYDTNTFTLNSIMAYKNTVLGAATVTNATTKTSEEGAAYDTYTTFGSLTDGANIVYENVDNTYIKVADANGTGDILIIANFTVNANPTQASAYRFGLADVNDVDTYAKDAFSTAWKNVPNEGQSGTHDPVYIGISEATVYVRGDLNLTLTGKTKTYDKIAATDAEITINGLPEINAPTTRLVWFDSTKTTVLADKPVNVGTYYVSVETDQTNYYNAYNSATHDIYATYTITPKAATIAFATKKAQYKSFTNSTFADYLADEDDDYCTITGLIGEETLNVVSLNATDILTSNAGDYNYTSDIHVTLADGTNGGLVSNYSITITGTFTITQKEIELGNTVYAVFNNGSFDYDGTLKTISATIAEAYTSILSVTSYTGGENGANGRTSVGTDTITATFSISDTTNYKFKKDDNGNDVNKLTATLTIVQTALTQSQVDTLVNAYVKFYAVDNGTENLLTITNRTGAYAKTYDAKGAYIGVVVSNTDNESKKLSTIVLYKDDSAELATEKDATALNNFADYAKTPAGVYTIIITVQPGEGYAFASGVTGAYTITLTINKAALTIKATSTVQYSDTDPVITVDNGNGWVASENYATYSTTAAALKAYVSDDYTAGQNANTTYTLSWNSDAETAIETIITNYEITLVGGEFTVAKKIVNANDYAFNGYTGVYDGQNHALTITPATPNYINVAFTSSATVKNVADSGEYTATITLATPSNYTFEGGNNTNWTVAEGYASASKTAQVTITPVTLHIEVAYTKTTATFSLKADDFVVGETASVITDLTYQVNSADISGNVYTISEYIANAITVSATSANTNYTIADATLKNIRKVEYAAGDYDSTKSGEDPVLPATDLLFDGFTTVEPAAVALNHYTFVRFATDASNSAAFDFTQVINADKVVYAIWEENAKYKVTVYYLIEADKVNPVLVSENELSYYSDDEVTYASLPTLTDRAWFKTETWYTTDALTTKFVDGSKLTADVTLYGNYKFNIGIGDVNANGEVNANDITLYRQWIVGGYEMTVVEKNSEWATVTANNFDSTKPYFLKRVADSNAQTAESTELGDNSLDIRDVSTIRMGMVGGYGFSIVAGKTVTGAELTVSRAVTIDTISQLLSVASSGFTAKPSGDITENMFEGAIENCANDVVIDLDDKTITLKSLSIALASGNTGKIEIKNGRINVIDGHGVTLSAPSGSVILTDVTFYDGDGQFTLQAANHSLHFDGIVRFLKDDNGSETAASVTIPASTHVVVEADAALTIEKIIVEEVAGSTTLSVDVQATNAPILVVEGYVETTGNNDDIVKPTCVEVATKEELTAAVADAYIKEIKLTADLTDIGNVSLPANVKFNGNGHKLSGNSALSAKPDGATIVNTTFENIHNTTALTAAQISTYNFTRTTGSLTAVYATNLSGKLTIENCNFNSTDWDAIQITPVAGAEITIKNNEFHNNNEAVRYVHIQSAKNVDFSATVRNNKFYNVSTLKETAIEVYYPANTEKLVITNNYIDSPIGVCVLVQNGANGFDLVQNFVQEDLTTPMSIVAYIDRGNTYLFTTLQAAIDAAKNGETITLLADVANGTGIMTKDGYPKTITIDFDGHTYTVTNTPVGSTGTTNQAMHWSIGSAITLKNGTFTVAANVAGLKMAMQNYGDLVVDNMTMDFTNVPQDYYGTYTGTYAKYSGLERPSFNVSIGDASLAINNSTLTFNSASNFGIYVEGSATITNSTINGTVALSTDGNGATATIIGSTVSGGVVPYFAGSVIVNNGNVYTVYVNEADAISANAGLTTKIGNTYYTEFANAIAAAKDGDTIVLVDNVALTATAEIKNNVTLDLNGNNITATNARAIWVQKGALNIIGNGTISANGETLSASSSVIRVGSGNDADSATAASLTIGENVTVSTDKCYGITVFGKNAAALTVNGKVLVTGTESAISGNGSSGLAQTNIIINSGATISATSDYAIYHPQAGTLTVNGGEIIGKGGIEAKGGNVIINDGTITATAQEVTHVVNNNGTSTSGYALVAVENSGYKGEGNFTISGSTINGAIAIIKDNNADRTPSISITGGTFSVDPSAYVADGYGVYEEDGKFVVTSATVNSIEEFNNAIAKGLSKIVLGANIEVTNQVVVAKDLTLDLNGKTIKYVGATTVTSGLFGVKRGATLTINDTVGTGKIDATSNKIYAAVALTISGESATGDTAKVVVNNGTLEGYYYAIVGNGNRHDTEIVVNNGTIYGVNGTAIYNPQNGKVSINNGNLKGLDTALEIRAGEVVINNGVFEALSETFSATANGSGTTIVGAIIAISQHSTLKNITVTINGGTFTNGIRALAMYDTINSAHSDLMKVTINGGTFNSIQNAATKTIDVNNGNLIINDGEFNSGADDEGLGCATVYAANYGYVTIKGGTFRASAKWDDKYWTLNVKNASKDTAKMVVQGGTYVEFDPSHPNTDDSVTYVAAGYQVVDNENNTYTVVAE